VHIVVVVAISRVFTKLFLNVVWCIRGRFGTRYFPIFISMARIRLIIMTYCVLCRYYEWVNMYGKRKVVYNITSLFLLPCGCGCGCSLSCYQVSALLRLVLFVCVISKCESSDTHSQWWVSIFVSTHTNTRTHKHTMVIVVTLLVVIILTVTIEKQTNRALIYN